MPPCEKTARAQRGELLASPLRWAPNELSASPEQMGAVLALLRNFARVRQLRHPTGHDAAEAPLSAD